MPIRLSRPLSRPPATLFPATLRPVTRRAGAAVAAAGLLTLVGAAPAGPPALPAPGAADAHPPGLAAPSPLSTAYKQAARPVPTHINPWRDLAAPGDAPEQVVENDAEPERKSRGWLSFAPLRVRPASNLSGPSYHGGTNLGGAGLSPEPDPISGPPSPRIAYAPQEFPVDGPAPAPLPIGDDADFAPVPNASGPSPGPSVTLPADTVIRRGMPVRDLRTPEPPPFAPPAVEVHGYGPAHLPPTGVPFGGPYHGGGPALGTGAGYGAGPIADLATAGGMCESGLCTGAVPLFGRVRIEDPENRHPCGLRQVVAVAAPRGPEPPCGLAKLFHDDCRGCARGCAECRPLCDAGPGLVFVEICVPPCRPEEVKVTRGGHRVHLDFGDYEVTLTSRDGCVEVDYDD